jgi:hypothetical protein
MATKTEGKTVTMTDGRIVEFGAKTKLKKTSKALDDGALLLTLDFANSETRTFTLQPSLLQRFALFGAEQRYADAASPHKDIPDMVKAVDALAAQFERGEWSKRGETDEAAGASILLRALAEDTGKPLEALKPWLAGKSPAEKAALKRSERLLPIIQRLEARDLAAKRNGGEAKLFEGL